MSQSASGNQSQPRDRAVVAAIAAQFTNKENGSGTIDAMTVDDINKEMAKGKENVETSTDSVDSGSSKGRKSQDIQDEDTEGPRPPLPPRPSLLQATGRPTTPHTTENPSILLSKPTTALSSVDIQTLSFPDGTRGTFSTPGGKSIASESASGTPGQSTPKRASRNGSDIDDNASLMSYAPTLKANGDLASLLDEGLNSQSPAWKLLSSQAESVNPFESLENQDTSLANFENEFDELDAIKGGNEGGWPSNLYTSTILMSC